MERLAVRKDRHPLPNKLETFLKFGKFGGGLEHQGEMTKLNRTKGKGDLALATKCVRGSHFKFVKTHNPLIISAKKAEFKLSFISANQKKVEICDLVLRNQ